MTNISDVKRVMNELVQDDTVKRLKNDEDFLSTVAIQYDEYIKEHEYIGDKPNWNLEEFVIDKIEWEENN